MAVPRLLLPELSSVLRTKGTRVQCQRQECPCSPVATIEPRIRSQLGTWEILLRDSIPSWNVGFKGLWTEADKWKWFFFFLLCVNIKNFSSLQLSSSTWANAKLKYSEPFCPKRSRGWSSKRSGEARAPRACSHYSEEAVCSHPSTTVSSF